MSTTKRGRPATGANKPLHVRCPPDFLERLDDWRRHQPEIPSRSESVRRLVDDALAFVNTDPDADQRDALGRLLRRIGARYKELAPAARDGEKRRLYEDLYIELSDFARHIERLGEPRSEPPEAED